MMQRSLPSCFDGRPRISLLDPVSEGADARWLRSVGMLGAGVSLLLLASCTCSNLRRGRDSLETRRYEQAIEELRAVEPGSYCHTADVMDAQILLGDAYLRLDRAELALKAYVKARATASKRLKEIFLASDEIEAKVALLGSDREVKRRRELVEQSTAGSARDVSNALSYSLERSWEIVELEREYQILEQETRRIRQRIDYVEEWIMELN